MDIALWGWVAVTGLIVAALLLDLLVFHREAHEISMRASSPSDAAPPASGSGTSVISTGRKCAAGSAGAGRPCRSSRQAHQPNVLRDSPCSAQYSPRLWPLDRHAST